MGREEDDEEEGAALACSASDAEDRDLLGAAAAPPPPLPGRTSHRGIRSTRLLLLPLPSDTVTLPSEDGAPRAGVAGCCAAAAAPKGEIEEGFSFPSSPSPATS